MDYKELTNKELRNKGRKKCWSPSQRFWMELSLYLTTPLVKTPITPNMVSVSWIFIEIFAAYLLTLGNNKINIIAILLFNFIALLGDHLDGNLARMKEKFSLVGPYLEQLGIFFGTPLIFLGLAIGNYLRFQNDLFFVISIAGVFFWLFEKLIRINVVWFGEKVRGKLKEVYGNTSLQKLHSKSKLSLLIELFRRGQPFNILFFCIILDYTQIASLIYSLFFMLEFFRRLWSTLSILKNIK